MNNLISYSGINTKVRAMDSKLISSDDYQKISTLDTTADLIAYLKKHPGYSEIFDKYEENEIHRDQAERLFINALFSDFTRIYRFANEEQRLDLELVFFRYEINALKSCIRFVFSDVNTYDTILFDPFFSKHSNINISALSQSHSMDEYLQNLKGTQYYPLLLKLHNKSNVTSFDYEMQLDVYYFTKSWQLKDKLLKGDNRKSFINRLGTEIDLLNIMWIYRSKKMYDINPADTYAFLIPINYKLSKAQLARLVAATTLDEYVNLLNTTRYKVFYQSLKDGTMESEYNNIIHKIYSMNTRKYPASMTTVNYYLYRKSTEIARLTTALECIRYGLDQKEKLRYMLQQ